MAMNFLASDEQSVTIADIAPIIGATSTTCYWMRTTQVGTVNHFTSPGILGCEEDSGVNDVFPGWIDDNGFINCGAGNGPFAQSLAAINDDIWHHIVCIYLVAGTAILYVDGVFQESVATEAGPKTTACTSFGRIDNPILGTPQYYDGLLDDLRIYDRELSEAEIVTMHAAQGVDGNVFGLRGRWTVNETAPLTLASGGADTIKDTSDDSNDGSPSGVAAQTFEIFQFNGGPNRFDLEAAEGDLTALFVAGFAFTITGSGSGNDGSYTVSSSTTNSGRTRVSVNEDISSNESPTAAVVNVASTFPVYADSILRFRRRVA